LKTLLFVRKLWLLAMVAFVTPVFGQITGEIRGVVEDASGAVVSSAKVTLKNLETSSSTTQTVNADGRFVFALLQVGSYEVKAEAPGFSSVVTRTLVKVGEVSVVPVKMAVGNVSETVTVTEIVNGLDLESAQIQTSVTSKAVQELPIGRNPNLLAVTTPGTAPVSANNPFLGTGSFNSNGGRGRGNNIMVDGITATDVSVTGTGGPLGPLNFASIKEVKIITNNFSAEYGRNSSAQVIYVTHNGTNQLRGEGYYLFRNDKLNSRAFLDRSGKPPIERFNEPGFRIGGPVLIPKIYNGSNKTFWHVDFDRTWLRGAAAPRVARVPTPTQAASVTDPTSRALLQQYQLPTDASGQILTTTANATDSKQYSFRIDQNFGDNDRVWFRYAWNDTVNRSPGLTFIGSNLPNFGATGTNTPVQMTANYTKMVTTRMVNEFRYAYGRSLPAFPINTTLPIGPRITFQDGSVDSFGVWEGLNQGRRQDTHQFYNTVSFSAGAHNLKAGGEFYHLRADSTFDSLARPLLTFANFADFAAGRPAIFQQRFGNSLRANRVNNMFGFFQDDWRVSRNLVLNLGVRYEWAGGPTEAQGRIANLNLDDRSAFGALGTGRWGRLITGQPSFTSNSNWAPRLGFSWNPGGDLKTVIRGGYGMAYDFIFLNPITNQRFLPPLMYTGVIQGQANFAGNNSLAQLVAGRADIQTSTAALVGNFNPSTVNFGAINPAIDENLRNPQVHQFNLGIQREIAGIILKTSYVGTKGNFLPRTRDINLLAVRPDRASSVADETARLAQFQAANGRLNGNSTTGSGRIDPRYNAIGWVDSSANSNYHSLQMEASRRWGNGLFISGNYTWAKSIDDGSDVLGVLINDSAGQQDPLNNRDNRAASQFDLRHRVVITHTYELPFFKGTSNAFLKQAFGGWSFAGITSFRTGFPITLASGARRGINPLQIYGGGINARPNVSGPVNIKWTVPGSAGAYNATSVPGDTVQAISTYAQSLGLSQPLLGNIGNMGRNVLRINGERNFDMTLFKNFRFSDSDRVYFQLRAEMFNAFNNTSWQQADAVLTSPTFGQYTVVGQNSRFFQLGARFVF
jgi:outer membrane receptor protein involved in Fe transport